MLEAHMAAFLLSNKCKTLGMLKNTGIRGYANRLKFTTAKKTGTRFEKGDVEGIRNMVSCYMFNQSLRITEIRILIRITNQKKKKNLGLKLLC